MNNSSNILFQTERLIIRNWRDEEADHDAYFRLNSDEIVMKYFPFRRTREECREKLVETQQIVSTKGYGFAPAIIKETGEIAGMAALMDATFDVPSNPSVEIGWRFLPEFWGKGYASEVAKGWLKMGFESLDLSEITSFAVPQNPASIAVMQRIGMTHDVDGDFDHPLISDEQAHLRRHVLYRITRETWLALPKEPHGEEIIRS